MGSASGGFGGAIVLYETALGVGIACGPILGGVLGNISWRGPFFGVGVLMLIALIATWVLVPATPRPAQRSSITEPLKALRHRSLATTSVTGLLYNWCFFTILGYAPFLMHLSPLKLGAVFCAWGVLVALFAVFGAPALKNRFGTPTTLYVSLALMAVVSLAIGIWPEHRWVAIAATVASGVCIGVNNTLVTTAVMSIAPARVSCLSNTASCGSSEAASPPTPRKARRALQHTRAVHPRCGHRSRRPQYSAPSIRR